MTEHGRCYKMMEHLSLEGTSWEHLVPLPLQVWSAKTGCQGPHPAGLWIAPQMETPQPIKKSLVVLDDFQNKQKCSVLSDRVSWFSVGAITSCPVGEHYWGKSGSLFLTSLMMYLYKCIWKRTAAPLWAFCTHAKKFQLSQDVVVQKLFQSLNNLLSFNILQ